MCVVYGRLQMQRLILHQAMHCVKNGYSLDKSPSEQHIAYHFKTTEKHTTIIILDLLLWGNSLHL